MTKQFLLALVVTCALTACAADKPRIIQATPETEEVRLRSGMATQIEIPDNARVQMVTVGNPNLVTADKADNVVSLMPKEGGAGETNIIVRALDTGGHANVYQYRVIVQN